MIAIFLVHSLVSIFFLLKFCCIICRPLYLLIFASDIFYDQSLIIRISGPILRIWTLTQSSSWVNWITLLKYNTHFCNVIYEFYIILNKILI